MNPVGYANCEVDEDQYLNLEEAADDVIGEKHESMKNKSLPNFSTDENDNITEQIRV